MKKRVRRFLPLAAVAAAAIAAGVLLATGPWGGEEVVKKAAAGNIEYRLCNVSLRVPPQPAIIRVSRSVEWSEDGLQPELQVSLMKPERSVVDIDPETGAALHEEYATPADEALIKGVLGTMRVGPLDPATAPWPYGDASQITVQRMGEKGTFEYRHPDPASGLVLWTGSADGIDWFSESLGVANCRSVIHIGVRFRAGAEPEVTVTKDIHPDDEAAFQTFEDEVTVKGLER